jgi:hypothetical protein
MIFLQPPAPSAAIIDINFFETVFKSRQSSRSCQNAFASVRVPSRLMFCPFFIFPANDGSGIAMMYQIADHTRVHLIVTMF